MKIIIYCLPENGLESFLQLQSSETFVIFYNYCIFYDFDHLDSTNV